MLPRLPSFETQSTLTQSAHYIHQLICHRNLATDKRVQGACAAAVVEMSVQDGAPPKIKIQK